MKDAIWFVLDLVIGVALAGIVAPLAIGVLPRDVQGPWVLWAAAVCCVVLVTIFRRTIVPGTSSGRGGRRS